MRQIRFKSVKTFKYIGQKTVTVAEYGHKTLHSLDQVLPKSCTRKYMLEHALSPIQTCGIALPNISIGIARLWMYIVCNIKGKKTMDVEAVCKPPKHVKNMQILERDAFKKTVTVPTLRIPASKVQSFLKSKSLKAKLLRMPNFKAVVDLTESGKVDSQFKCVVLDPEKVTSISDFSEKEYEALEIAGVELVALGKHDIELNYTNWNYDEILHAILPDGQGTVAGFSKIGHIVHLNLEEELHPYKAIIGKL